MSERFKLKIGLEIHVQLKTRRKMFCGCDNRAEGKEPNALICPICLGLPGTLPVPNREAIAMAIKTGLALDCQIAPTSRFDRKHYFYPDLPKGYQISQYDQPLCRGGYLEISVKNGKVKRIKMNRVHLEEDAGKLIHTEGASFTRVDLNRAGTPLMEIVTEPDIESPTQAKFFLKELQLILRQLGVSRAEMEKGHLRCDANISAHRSGRMSEIVEIKNLNSFRFVERALIFEGERLKKEYRQWPPKRTKVTRGWDSKRGLTYALRQKEEAKDYRYFPEPDLPPIEPGKLGLDIKEIAREAEWLAPKRRVYLQKLGLGHSEVEIISKDDNLFSKLKGLADKDLAAARPLGRILAFEESSRGKSEDFLLQLGRKMTRGGVTSSVVRKILSSGQLEIEAADKHNLEKTIQRVLAENQEAVLKYRSGKTQVVGFLVGAVMKRVVGVAEPSKIKDEINKILSEDKDG